MTALKLGKHVHEAVEGETEYIPVRTIFNFVNIHSSQFNSQHGHVLAPAIDMMQSVIVLFCLGSMTKSTVFSLIFEKVPFINTTKYQGGTAIVALLDRDMKVDISG